MPLPAVTVKCPPFLILACCPFSFLFFSLTSSSLVRLYLNITKRHSYWPAAAGSRWVFLFFSWLVRCVRLKTSKKKKAGHIDNIAAVVAERGKSLWPCKRKIPKAAALKTLGSGKRPTRWLLHASFSCFCSLVSERNAMFAVPISGSAICGISDLHSTCAGRSVETCGGLAVAHVQSAGATCVAALLFVWAVCVLLIILELFVLYAVHSCYDGVCAHTYVAHALPSWIAGLFMQKKFCNSWLAVDSAQKSHVSYFFLLKKKRKKTCPCQWTNRCFATLWANPTKSVHHSLPCLLH